MTARPHIFVVGEIDRAEFASTRDWLRQNEQSSELTRGTYLAGSFKTEPDLVIVCQSWPDEFSSGDVTSVLSRWPLTLWVVCYGEWCASDGRTRTIWPLSVRVPAQESAARLDHVWRILRDQREPPLPLTASRDEMFAFDANRDVTRFAFSHSWSSEI